MVIGPTGHFSGAAKNPASVSGWAGAVPVSSWSEKINEIVAFGTAKNYARYAFIKALSWLGFAGRPVKANLVFPSWQADQIHSIGFDGIEFSSSADLGTIRFGIRLRHLKSIPYHVRIELRPHGDGMARILCDEIIFGEAGPIAEMAGIPLCDEAQGMKLCLKVTEVQTGRVVYELSPFALKKLAGLPERRSARGGFLRRGVDLAFGLALLAANVVIGPWVALLTFVFISRNIFYHVDRPGPGGRFVKVWKYRTMPTTRIARISEFDASYFPVVGICIRALGLDELPQCLNILKGEWQVFGPRSVNIGVEVEGTPLEAHEYNAEIYGGLKPGLFNLTSALMGKGKDAINLPTRLRYERYHQRYRTGFLDVKIFIRSVMEILLLENVEDYLRPSSAAAQNNTSPGQRNGWGLAGLGRSAALRGFPLAVARLYQDFKRSWSLSPEQALDAS